MLAPVGAGPSKGIGPPPRNSFDLSSTLSLNITVKLVNRLLRYFFSTLRSGFGSFSPPAGSRIRPWVQLPVNLSILFTYGTHVPVLSRHRKC
jgi:hypothetical protein